MYLGNVGNNRVIRNQLSLCNVDIDVIDLLVYVLHVVVLRGSVIRIEITYYIRDSRKREYVYIELRENSWETKKLPCVRYYYFGRSLR